MGGFTPVSNCRDKRRYQGIEWGDGHWPALEWPYKPCGTEEEAPPEGRWGRPVALWGLRLLPLERLPLLAPRGLPFPWQEVTKRHPSLGMQMAQPLGPGSGSWVVPPDQP